MAAAVPHQLGETVLWHERPPAPPPPNPLKGGRYVSGSDDGLWTLLFKDGRKLWKAEQFERALPVFERTIGARPDLDVALYAANIVMDILLKTEKYDELTAFVAKLRSNITFVASHPEIAGRLLQLHRHSKRRLVY
ncbi:MAG: hypothetical protein KJO07_19620 [Deltaproteobacteria bacterium]|nr:hypothetical protein [Deltaproteobacteria bacterium]